MFAKEYTRLPLSEPNCDGLENKKRCPYRRLTGRTHQPVVIYVLGFCFALATTVVLALIWTSRTLDSSSKSCDSLAVRHEWRDLSKEEKKEYLQAVRCLREHPSSLGLNQSLYDDFPYFHTRTGEDGKFRLEIDLRDED